MRRAKRIQKIKPSFPLSWRGWLVYAGAMGLASLLCALLRRVSTSDVHVPLIFILAVLVVSLMTDGYFYGLLAALTSVFTVNVVFTYPYMKMDFSAYGYPLTFLTMTAVGVAVSTLTARVREQEQLRLETERERVRANLLRAVSHDLRTPLTSISGSIAAVLEGDVPPEQRELLEGAREDADWLYRMVENLLSVTRIGSDGPSGLRIQPEPLEEVLGAAAASFRKRHPGIAIHVAAPEEPLFVPMDPVLIQQVLQNLMDNAVLHGRHTTCIDVCARQDRGQAVISVADDGAGIDRALLGHLFEEGMRGPASGTADTTRGLGIGLTVCRTIVEAHGGTIRAENRPGGGAEFTFTLAMEAKSDDDP